MNEERQQRVVAAFNTGRKPRAVANEVGASEAAITRAFRNIKAWGSCYPPELVKRGRPRILTQYHEDVGDVHTMSGVEFQRLIISN
jgi:transposase